MSTPRQHGKAYLTEIYGRINLGADMPELPLLPLLPEDEPEDGSDG